MVSIGSYIPLSEVQMCSSFRILGFGIWFALRGTVSGIENGVFKKTLPCLSFPLTAPAFSVSLRTRAIC